jgi:hypothetical protein
MEVDGNLCGRGSSGQNDLLSRGFRPYLAVSCLQISRYSRSVTLWMRGVGPASAMHFVTSTYTSLVQDLRQLGRLTRFPPRSA